MITIWHATQLATSLACCILLHFSYFSWCNRIVSITHVHTASCWWDSYRTLYPCGSRPGPHNVVHCLKLKVFQLVARCRIVGKEMDGDEPPKFVSGHGLGRSCPWSIFAWTGRVSDRQCLIYQALHCYICDICNMCYIRQCTRLPNCTQVKLLHRLCFAFRSWRDRFCLFSNRGCDAAMHVFCILLLTECRTNWTIHLWTSNWSRAW